MHSFIYSFIYLSINLFTFSSKKTLQCIVQPRASWKVENQDMPSGHTFLFFINDKSMIWHACTEQPINKYISMHPQEVQEVLF